MSRAKQDAFAPFPSWTSNNFLSLKEILPNDFQNNGLLEDSLERLVAFGNANGLGPEEPARRSGRLPKEGCSAPAVM